MEVVPLGPLGPNQLSDAGPSYGDSADTLAAEPDFAFTIDELRKLPEEAIARGRACERARAEAWKRRWRYALVVAVPTLLASAAAWCLCR
jgi:hypothetical protein